MNKPKNSRLQVEISVITVLIFAVILVFSSLSNYYVTRESYLNSKNEMIDRDLKNLNESILQSVNMPEYWSYTKDHAEDMTRESTEKENAFSETEEARNMRMNLILNGDVNFSELSPEFQFDLVRHIFQLLTMNTDYHLREFNYTDISYLTFPNDKEAFLYFRCNEEEPDPLQDEFEYNTITAVCYDEAYKTIDYDVSDHPAVKKILDGKVKEGETVYEVWSDPEDGKDYYLGYSPLVCEGKTVCYICIKYDWTTFRSELVGRVVKTMIFGLTILIVLNGLLILLIHKRAIAPLTKVKKSVQTYMEDKDSGKVHDAMNGVKVSNEIGVLADSFSALATEIDVYTEENMKLGAEKERIATELSLATNIQAGMLPSVFPAFPDRKEFDIYASMDPAKEVGGDFYDFFLIDDDHLAMVIADVSGKGVPAALFMMSSKILINDHAIMGGTPAEILERVNKQIYANNEAEMFVTVWLGILEISTGKLTTSSAGHEFPIIRTTGKYELLKDKHGLPIGIMPKSKYKNFELTLKKGDSIFVYTDGVAEATNASDELFGTDRTIEALNAVPEDASQQEVLRSLRSTVDAFVKEAPQFDDLTMLGLKYFGPDND